MKIKRSFLWLFPPYDQPEMSNPSSLKEIKAALERHHPVLGDCKTYLHVFKIHRFVLYILESLLKYFLSESPKGRATVYLQIIQRFRNI